MNTFVFRTDCDIISCSLFILSFSHVEFIGSTREGLEDVVANRQRAIEMEMRSSMLTTVYTCVYEYAKQYTKTCHKQLVVQSSVLLTAS